MSVRGRSEPLPPSYTRCARSISMLRPFREGIHLERLTLRKPAAFEPSTPSGSPTSRTLFILLLSSISVIFSVSRSSWFLRSVTVLLSSRASAWTESTRSRVCFSVVAIASSSSLSSLTDLWSLVCPHAVRAMLESAPNPPHLLLPKSQPNSKCFAAL